jgi:drug/metabolite transporter (DMT)-like permease
MMAVAFMLWPVVLIAGSWRGFTSAIVVAMAISGLIGIFVGDTALFAASNRLGPRRAGVLYSTNAVFSALFGFILFAEKMNLTTFVGTVFVMVGVSVAIFMGRDKEDNHAWEADAGSLKWGIILGVIAAICQSIGSLIAKPVMTQGVDPIAASALRVSFAGAAHWVLLWSGFAAARSQNPLNKKILWQTALNGWIAMGIGMTCILLALKNGNVGVVAVLSSVSPVLLLPLLWWHLGRRPALGAWLGAILTVLGTVLILFR